jgi:hypothetical protein
MTAYPHPFETFKSALDLTSRLAAISARKRLQSVSIGVRINGRRMFAATRGAIRLEPNDAADHLVPAACLAKPLTATLVAEAAAKHHVDWSNPVSEVLALENPWKARLTGITLSHLLNHTHGLDASAVHRAPRTRDGFLDVKLLCSQLAAEPLSAPGRLYSYGSAGAWFAGAVLERLCGRQYSHLLYDCRLWRSAPRSPALPFGNICPATGDELELTVSEWLALLEAHLKTVLKGADEAVTPVLSSLRAAPVPLPGWSPFEQGACLGWKYFGEGWFGHNSNLAGSSALLRFNPDQHIAIVIEASDEAAFIVLAELFGTALAEFSNLKPPRLLNPQECATLQLDRYVGTYVQAHSRLNIVKTSQGTLCLAVRTQDSSAETSQRPLRPAAEEVFIPESRDNLDLAFVQFIASDPMSGFGYLWNGKQLWRRSDCAHSGV